jgi:hypothetical protein
MEYFKYLDIPNIETIQQQILDILPEDIINNDNVVFLVKTFPELYSKIKNIPELAEFIKKNGWTENLVSMVFHSMSPKSTFDIHTDPIPETMNHIRILFPVKNCEDTYTRFYTSDIPPKTEWIYPADGSPPQPYNKYYEENCTLVAQANLRAPYFINTQSIHGIYNPTNNRRMTLWLNFDNRIDLLRNF